MKTLQLAIIVIACIVSVSVIWYFTSYDPTPVTKENNFGINALVIHSPPYMGCPTVNCQQPNYYLKINSKSNTFLLGYTICDGNSCVKQDGLAISLSVLDVLHPDYRKLPLPDNLPWKDGDSVNIQVKVPSSFIFDNASTFDSTHTPKIWVDLGKSEIVRSS
ncbi:hypothetical protein [Candidatus Nitrosotalea okcheonensis]|uniref:Uncharacterized protein n=1 Tax=Candidatus Nitrosotalea okcheonensis TaxID=1903276 RepID=A0A2H1FIR9_9ARCH|nr:hypothetical protein [Candidatus Nitrosotalea okcheonensis]SMH72661.1 protein of unknown function [Candidatus Nitrosotalea okcheonensis]